MKKIFSSLLTILMVVSICSCSSNMNVDEDVIGSANSLFEMWDFEEGRTFSVVKNDQDIYHVDINGQELLFKVEKDYNIENAKSNITECDSEVLEVVKASKDKVINYINDSKILKDKEELVNYINNIPVKMADFASDKEAEYDYESDSIFINNKHREDICEWAVAHEFICALSNKTNGGVQNERYPHSLFNEVLRHNIIVAMHLEIVDHCPSKYLGQYNYVRMYLACVGIDGIEAYFYGYDEILERIPEAELDIFVDALEQVDYNEDAVIIVCNCINEWGGKVS